MTSTPNTHPSQSRDGDASRRGSQPPSDPAGSSSARQTEEWIGKHPDQAIPPRVRLRVFERYRGRCHLSGRKIMPGEKWDIDHIIALINGGEHRESNFAPALRDKHREKTALDVAEKARSARKRMAHIGIKARKQKIPSRPFPKSVPRRPATSPLTKRVGQFGETR